LEVGGRRQRSEVRSQRSEGRKQRTAKRRWRLEAGDRGRKSEIRDNIKTEVGGQKSEIRGQKTEDREGLLENWKIGELEN